MLKSCVLALSIVAGATSSAFGAEPSRSGRLDTPIYDADLARDLKIFCNVERLAKTDELAPDASKAEVISNYLAHQHLSQSFIRDFDAISKARPADKPMLFQALAIEQRLGICGFVESNIREDLEDCERECRAGKKDMCEAARESRRAWKSLFAAAAYAEVANQIGKDTLPECTADFGAELKSRSLDEWSTASVNSSIFGRLDVPFRACRSRDSSALRLGLMVELPAIMTDPAFLTKSPAEALVRWSVLRLEGRGTDFEARHSAAGYSFSMPMWGTREFPQRKLDGRAVCSGSRCLLLLLAHTSRVDMSWIEDASRTPPHP